MCPIVDIDPEAQDKRKNKDYHWREGRLTLAYANGTVGILSYECKFWYSS